MGITPRIYFDAKSCPDCSVKWWWRKYSTNWHVWCQRLALLQRWSFHGSQMLQLFNQTSHFNWHVNIIILLLSENGKPGYHITSCGNSMHCGNPKPFRNLLNSLYNHAVCGIFMWTRAFATSVEGGLCATSVETLCGRKLARGFAQENYHFITSCWKLLLPTTLLAAPVIHHIHLSVIYNAKPQKFTSCMSRAFV